MYEPGGVHHPRPHRDRGRQVRRRYHREGMAARWVGTRILRHIPGEVVARARWTVNDLRFAAVREDGSPPLAAEILRFRYEKLVGTVRGHR